MWFKWPAPHDVQHVWTTGDLIRKPKTKRLKKERERKLQPCRILNIKYNKSDCIFIVACVISSPSQTSCNCLKWIFMSQLPPLLHFLCLYQKSKIPSHFHQSAQGHLLTLRWKTQRVVKLPANQCWLVTPPPFSIMSSKEAPLPPPPSLLLHCCCSQPARWMAQL